MASDLIERLRSMHRKRMEGMNGLRIFGEAADALTEAIARAERAEAECVRLRTALHDAICRPMGVVPESADEFYSATEGKIAMDKRLAHSRALDELIAGDAHLIDTVADSDGDDGL